MVPVRNGLPNKARYGSVSGLRAGRYYVYIGATSGKLSKGSVLPACVLSYSRYLNIYVSVIASDT